MKALKIVTRVMACLMVCSVAWGQGAGAVRIKDIVRIAGLESTDLIGYGVVVGLNGSGDRDITLAQQTLANLVEQFSLKIDVDDVVSQNAAAVMVTASAPAFHTAGDRVDVTVSSVGDAESLSGGILLMTPLRDPSGAVYALAQGALTVGGFSVGAGGRGGETVQRNSTTVAHIPEAGLLRKSQDVAFIKNGVIRLLLRHPDFTTADRIASVINDHIGASSIARDAGTVAVHVPSARAGISQLARFISEIEMLRVTPDTKALIVINERTGTIVMGANVNLGQAVVAHGNLTVTIKETLHPSHPSNLFLGRNAAPDIRSLETPDVETFVDEERASVMVMPQTTSVQQLADTLNLMGATPRDLISILQALRRAGSLQSEIEVM